MLTHEAITGIREYFMNRIAYAKYTVAGQAHTTRIESAAIIEDGRITVSLIVNNANAGDTVTEVCLYDANDILLVHKAETVAHEPNMGGIYYRFFFRIEEVE